MLTAGLRLREVQQLRWLDVDLGNELLFVQGDKGDKLRGTFTRKQIPLPPETVAALANWKAECGHAADADKVVLVPTSFVKTLDDDLRAAGIPKRDALKGVVDCHALRHTYGNLLIASGADIKTCQNLMRHATPALTLAVRIRPLSLWRYTAKVSAGVAWRMRLWQVLMSAPLAISRLP